MRGVPPWLPIACDFRTAVRRGSILLVLTLPGCGPRVAPPPAPIGQEDAIALDAKSDLFVAQPLATRKGPTTEAVTNAETLFESIPANSCGIDFIAAWQPRNKQEAALLKTGFSGGGVSLGDYDGDGLVDVFLTRPHGGGRLFRNLGAFHFDDVTDDVGIASVDDWHTGAAFCDVDNDGDLDLSVACYDSPNRLFLNEGDGTFRDVAATTGLNFSGASVKTLFADYDQDGDLDAYVLTNRLEPVEPRKIRYIGKRGSYDVAPEHRELAMVINLPDGQQKFAKAGQYDRLYRNELSSTGTLQFTDVSRAAGLSGPYHGLDGCWWDPDGDGDADLYITNDFTDPDQFLQNNGDGTFSDVTIDALPCTPWFAMGCATGDLNNDGRFDLLAADMSGTTHYRQKIAMGSMDSVAWFLDTAEPRQYMRNALYLNTGTPRFTEAAQLAGLASSDWTWSVKIADFDNDGDEDCFFTNGFTRDYLNSDFNNAMKASRDGEKLSWFDAPRLEEQNVAFRNDGELSFADVSREWGLDHTGISFGAAVGDLDNDGDLDLVVSNFGEPPTIYRNRSASGNICAIELGGNPGEQSVGSTVEVTTNQGQSVRYHNPVSGFLSSNDARLHVGIGEAKRIEQITVRWPSGTVQRLEDLPANHLISIHEPTDHTKLQPSTSKLPPAMFTESVALPDVLHKETIYDDFQQQPLLPNKLSQLGPGMAIGDINADGRKALFQGGAAGHTGTFLVQNSDHTFNAVPLECLEQHRGCEDMGCLFADFDGDSDLDLYVVSGGVESSAGTSSHQDRIYTNESTSAKIHFEYAAHALPELRDSGGPIAAADYDRDGDLDLFIGSRMIPGQYPTPPTSRLLKNEAGIFSEVKSDVADAGMVTAAIWSDYDDDGWVDLLVANDYGPVRVFRNNAGELIETSGDLATQELSGWWNSIVGCDFDLDGDTDYVVGNLGRNTKYHPTRKKPQHLFYGKFHGAGANHIVEAKTAAKGLLPTRGRSCSSLAMPLIEKKFGTFHEFASASLTDIYPESNLRQALQVAATVVESGVFVNTLDEEGSRRFKFLPLPNSAQLSPVFGMEVMHANDDAFPDLFLAQNFFTPQRETGRMDGGVGAVLLGNGDGTFTAVSPVDSGIVIPEDAKSTIAADLNNDGRLELLVGINNDRTRSFSLAVPSIPAEPFDWAVGATIRATAPNGRTGKFERYLGSGYLSAGSDPRIQLPPRSRFDTARTR